MDNQYKEEKCEKRKITIGEKVFRYFKEYCDATGIHGLRYVTEDRTLIEKFWWIICIILSFTFCGFMVYEIFDKYFTFPITVTFSMHEMPIQDIPFPAVTICPRAKISLSYFNITEMVLKEKNGTLSCEEEKNLNMASMICEHFERNETFSCDPHTTEEEFFDFLINSSIPILHKCRYRKRDRDCSKMFTRILTEDGICYVYNILDKKNIFKDDIKFPFSHFHSTELRLNWTVEGGYLEEADMAHPVPAFRQGASNALQMILKTKKSDVEALCSSGNSGYRLSLTLPSKIPDITENHINIPLDQTVNGIIIPSVVRTSKEVRKFPVAQRDCYFTSEKELKYFKTYNEMNCLLECKTEQLLEFCNCVKMHMPKLGNSSSCLYSDSQCLRLIEILLSAYDSEFDCDCQPTCTDIYYNLEISQNKLSLSTLDKNLDHDYHYSVVNLYFKKNFAETKERIQVYGFTDLVSSFGGILGLFTGFSILSFAEIIYFLTLRIWGNFQLPANKNN